MNNKTQFKFKTFKIKKIIKICYNLSRLFKFIIWLFIFSEILYGVFEVILLILFEKIDFSNIFLSFIFEKTLFKKNKERNMNEKKKKLKFIKSVK